MLGQKSILHAVTLHLIAVLFVILNVSDIRIAGISHVIPLFDLMMVFYFAVFRRNFSIWFIFLLGLWNDAINGNPLGATSLCYIFLVKLFSLLNHRFIIKENFQQLWQQFIAFCFCFLVMKWLILLIFSDASYSLNGVVVQFILSSLLYVLMHKFFDYLSQKLLEEI